MTQVPPAIADPPPSASPPPRARPQALRFIHSVSQIAMLVVIWWTATLGQLYSTTFQELSMTQLPVPTEIVVKMSGVILQPGVLIVGGAIVLAVVVAGHFGLMDRALAPLIVANLLIIAFALIGWLVGLQQPMRQIQQTLGP